MSNRAIRQKAAWKKIILTAAHRLGGMAVMLKPAGIPGFASPVPSLPLEKEIRKAVADKQRELLAARGSRPLPAASADEEAALARITRDAAKHNRNNVTRTAAYMRLYRTHPELHWALLAHMVSRNGGWCMTDLRGEPLARLLPERLRRDLFLFLESANAHIFHDAFPQLLLYAESRRAGRPLFRLLPRLGVSRFMEPVWAHFWETRNPVLLTIGLIINEQNLIERRVLGRPYFRRKVLKSAVFRAQSRLKFNHVYLPYLAEDAGPLRLAGVIVGRFPSVDERIAAGRRLYALLFGPTPLAGRIRQFAEHKAHTGSRADYWPHLFTPDAAADRTGADSLRLDGIRVKPGGDRLYSPALADAWPDYPFRPVPSEDWFVDESSLQQWKAPAAPRMWDMTDAAAVDLNALEDAAWLKELWGRRV